MLYCAVLHGAEHVDALDLDVASILEYRNGLVDSVGAQAAEADAVQVKDVVRLECVCLQVELAANCCRTISRKIGCRKPNVLAVGNVFREVFLEPGHCRAVHAVLDDAGTS